MLAGLEGVSTGKAGFFSTGVEAVAIAGFSAFGFVFWVDLGGVLVDATRAKGLTLFANIFELAIKVAGLSSTTLEVFTAAFRKGFPLLNESASAYVFSIVAGSFDGTWPSCWPSKVLFCFLYS